jgi:hypothetical protein
VDGGGDAAQRGRKRASVGGGGGRISYNSTQPNTGGGGSRLALGVGIHDTLLTSSTS